MATDSRKPPGPRPRKPLDRQRLEELALAYVARFSVPSARLSAYLSRKLRERGWEGGCEPGVDAIVERFVAAGYVDDAAWAASRSAGLLRRGYGERRIGQALADAGIDGELRRSVRASESAARQAVLAMARKRGFGPFGSDRPDRAMREKQIAAMLRAGHRLDSARELIDAPSIEAAESWAAAGDGDSGCD